MRMRLRKRPRGLGVKLARMIPTLRARRVGNSLFEATMKAFERMRGKYRNALRELAR